MLKDTITKDKLHFIGRGILPFIDQLVTENDQTPPNPAQFDFDYIDLKPDKAYRSKLDILKTSKQAPINIFDLGNFTFELSWKKSKVYKYIYDVHYKGFEFAVVSCSPYKGMNNPPDELKVEINNARMYEEHEEMCNEFLKTCKIKYVHPCELDIAVDGVNMLELIQKWIDKKVDIIGKAGVNPRMDNNRSFNYVMIGQKSSDKYARIYNKDAEIDNNSKKYYIKKMWKENGLTEEEMKDRQRFEVSARWDELKKYPPIKWKDLFNPKKLASLLRSLCKNFIEFVSTRSNKAKRSQRKRIRYIMWSKLGAVLLEKLTAKITSEVYMRLKTGKLLFEEAIRSGESKFIELSEYVFKSVDQLKYFWLKRDEWEMTVEKRMKRGRYKGKEYKFRDLELKEIFKKLVPIGEQKNLYFSK